MHPEWLVSAAERATLHPSVDAVILFGSRARAAAHEDSDRDLCLVGSRRPREIETLLEDLDSDQRWPENARFDALWRTRHRLRTETHAGTVWADVVAHGQVLAGDGTILDGIPIRPMQTRAIGLALELASDWIASAATGTRHPRTAELRGVETTTRAAVELARALTEMLGEIPAAGRCVHRHAVHLRELALSAERKHARTLKAAAQAIERTNRSTNRGHEAWHTGYREARRRWETRLARLMDLLGLIVQGLDGTGPLAELRTHRPARRATTPTRHAVRQACREIQESGTDSLAAGTAQAFERLHSACRPD